MKKNVILAVTPGDPDGIGPEILLKAIRRGVFSKDSNARFLCVGAAQPFLSRSGYSLFPEVTLADIQSNRLDWNSSRGFLLAAPTIKKKSACPGFQSGWSIEAATQLVLSQRCDAIVTGPISKVRLQSGGYPYSGHTDFLAKLCGVPQVTMMLANPTLRVSLVTVHHALSSVPKLISRSKIRLAAENTLHYLNQLCGIKTPKIAILALNPHAGEAGLFGHEESKIISPEIAFLNRKYQGKARFSGPFPADTFFAIENSKDKKTRFDAVIAMYHDQGLIPVKLLDFQNTVNITLGLPIIRTSVDHGVAFDIAGKNLADPSSFIAATELALELVRNRNSRRR